MGIDGGYGKGGDNLGRVRCCGGTAAAGHPELSSDAGEVRHRDCGRDGDGAAVGFEAQKVLKGVGLVEVRREGRQMPYKVNAMAIRPLHEWTSTFERLWKHQLMRIKERAEANNAQKQ